MSNREEFEVTKGNGVEERDTWRLRGVEGYILLWMDKVLYNL